MIDPIAESIARLDPVLLGNNPIVPTKKPKLGVPHCIKWRGQTLQIGTKIVWRRIGDAKLAFIARYGRYIDNVLRDRRKELDPGCSRWWGPTAEQRKEVMDALIEQGILEFVPFEDAKTIKEKCLEQVRACVVGMPVNSAWAIQAERIAHLIEVNV